MKHCWDGLRKLLITWGTNETSIYICIFFFRTHDSTRFVYAGGSLMKYNGGLKLLIYMFILMILIAVLLGWYNGVLR